MESEDVGVSAERDLVPDRSELDPWQAWQELLALAEGPVLDEDGPTSLISIVQTSGDPQLVDASLQLLSDPLPIRRQWASRVLAQFGFGEGRPFGGRIAAALAAAARRETDDATRAEIVDALGSAEDAAWVPELLHHAGDPHPGVRLAVAGSLPLIFAGEPLDDDAVRTLITLTSDEDAVVRDWATMSLGRRAIWTPPRSEKRWPHGSVTRAVTPHSRPASDWHGAATPRGGSSRRATHGPGSPGLPA